MRRRDGFLFVTFLSFYSLKCSYTSTLLDLMTDDEIQSIFQTDRKSAPKHELVTVLHSVSSENPKNPEIYFKAFGHDISLYLWPTEGMLFGEHTPIYTVRSNQSALRGLQYTKYNEYGLYYAYRDEDNNAAIIVRQDKNKKFKFDGTFNKKYVIRSLPERIAANTNEMNILDHESSLFLKFTANKHQLYTSTNPHIIFNMNEKHYKLKNPKDIIISVTDNLSNSLGFTMTKNKLYHHESNENTVYPEILVIVDYDTFKSFGSDISETLVYLSAFWNGVDLRYRALDNPRIHLNIAMIIIALDEDATPYLRKNRVNDAISNDAIKDIGRYFYEETRFRKDSYDILIVITKLKVCEWPIMRNNESSCIGLRGISGFGSACAWNDRDKELEAVALVHDGGFNGIATAAHELGHILGVPHDGSPSASYIGGPGATKCRWEDGYLMSSERFTENAFKWSPCSKQCFEYFLKSPMSKCLRNQPKLSIELPRILPGTLMSLNEQCYNAGALDACYHDERACTLLYCTNKNNTDECIATSPAAEGSTCGKELICIQGQCVKKRQWKTVKTVIPYF